MPTAPDPHHPVDARDVIADRVGRLRRRRGWTVEELADATGFDVALILTVERGTTVLPVAGLARIATALDVRIEDLVTR